MKKKIIGATLFGIGMGIIWSIVFTHLLGSTAGIGVGVCFGIAFAFVGVNIFEKKDK